MFYFYSLRDCRTPNHKGRKLIKTLWRVYPDVFGHFEQEVETGIRGYHSDLTGLLVKYDDANIVCIAVMTELKLDRILTLPKFRNLGHATKLLKCLRTFGDMSDISFLSPVDSNVIPLFEKSGWEIRKKGKVNKDGTIDYLSSPVNFEEVMEAGHWLQMLKVFNKLMDNKVVLGYQRV